MIAQSPAKSRRATSGHPSPTAVLSVEELHQLTLFKWRYALESAGFTGREVQDLAFLGWLRAKGQLES